MATAAKKQTTVRTERTVTFEVKTRKPLPVGEQVFITGDIQMLGRWRPDGFPLTRMGENTWGGTAILPSDRTIEFKITRGSWNDEEILDDGSAPANGVIPSGGDHAVRRSVAAWKDGR